MDADGAGLAAALFVVATGAAVQGAVGFGFALVAAPLLVLLDPALVPGPLIASSLVLTLLMVWRDRRAIDYAGVRWTTLGRIPGTVLAAAILEIISRDAITVSIGVVTLFGVTITAAGPRMRPTPAVLASVGAISGLMGTISSIGGPPIALVYQHSPGSELRGTLAGVFVIGGVVSLAALTWIGRFGSAEITAAIVLLPGVLFGFAISGRIAARLDRGHTRRAVLTVSATAALAAVVTNLL